MICSRFLAALAAAALVRAQASSTPPSPVRTVLENNTSLLTANAMVPGLNGTFYVSGRLDASQPSNLAPGVIRLADLANFPQSYVARVSASGNGVFWMVQTAMQILTLQSDSQGNVWAAGLASNQTPAGAIGPCQPTSNPFNSTLAIAKFSPDGTQLLPTTCYSAPLGAVSVSGYPYPPLTLRMQIDSKGGVYLAGQTGDDRSTLPSTPGTVGVSGASSQAFLVKFQPDLAGVVYATSIPGVQSVNALAVTPTGSVVIGGATDDGVQGLASTQAAAQSQAGGGALLRSQDLGVTWKSISTGLPSNITRIVVANANPNVLYAFSQTGIAISTDGGDHWANLAPPSGSTSLLNGNSSCIINAAGDILYCLDFFNLWRYHSGQWTNVKPYNLNPTNGLLGGAGNAVYAVSYNTSYASPDGGATWQPIPNPPGTESTYSFLYTVPADETYLMRNGITNGNPTLLFSHDLGQTWTTVPIPEAGTVQFHPSNSAFLLLQANSHYYRSLDRGQTWSQLLNLPCTNLVPSVKGTDYFNCTVVNTPVELNLATGEMRRIFSDFGSAIPTPLLGGSPYQQYAQRGSRADGYVCQLSPTAAAFNFCTYIGGWGADTVTHLIAARDGGYWIAGTTTSRNFPVTKGALQSLISFYGDSETAIDYNTTVESPDVFLAKMSGDGSRFSAVTYFGGSLDETPLALWEDAQGEPSLLGLTKSWDFPVTANGTAYFNTTRPVGIGLPGPDANAAFILHANAPLTSAVLASALSLYPWLAAAFEPTGMIGYAGLSTHTQTLQSMPYAIGELDLNGTLAGYVQPYGFVEPYQGTQYSLTAGAPARMLGVGLAQQSAAAAGPPYGPDLGGVRVLIDGSPVPLISVAPGQIDFLVPWATGPGGHTVTVIAGGVTTPDTPVWIYGSHPLILRDPATLIPLAFNEDGSPHGPSNPVPPGGVLRVILTGIGQVASPPPDGAITDTQSPALLPVSVQVGPFQADLVYAGAAVGYTGLSEVQFRIPASTPPSEYSLWVTVNGSQSERALITVGGGAQ